jgi:hypothetical protein
MPTAVAVVVADAAVAAVVVGAADAVAEAADTLSGYNPGLPQSLQFSNS